MRKGGGTLAVRALEDEGIPFAFGIPGTHNIELWDAFQDSLVKPVLVTDEQSASFMADAVWRASGRMATVAVVPGAGLTHTLSGVAEALLDNVPLLVLGCGIRRDTGHAYQLHDVDQLAIARPVTKGVFRPEKGEEIYATIRRACRLARAGAPGPVFVEIPADHYFTTHAEPPPSEDAQVVARKPEPALVDRAVALLRGARRPLLYVGFGAAGAGTGLVDLAERLESPVVSTLQGKGVFPESHPLALWPGFGAMAPPFVREVVAGCDATLAIGCRFSEVGTGSYGAVPPQPLIHADIDPSVFGRNFPAEVAIEGDARELVELLVARLPAGRPDAALRAEIARGRDETRREMKEPGERGVTPTLLLAAFQRVLGPETIFTSDSGNGTFLAAEGLVLEKPGRLLSPVDYSCMGYAVPAAIGAKLACAGAPVVALAGDGAFLMTGLELLTAAHGGVAIVCAVFRDRELAQIAQFQGTALGRKVASELPDFDLEGLCRALGVTCLRLGGNAEIEPVLAAAAEIARGGRPVAIDVAIDYSRKTFFTRGVVKTNFLRLPWRDRLRFAARAFVRKVKG
ncbi:MAG TPA: thiamine pyrophosphate-binding protein [Thermoanaerobaculia bacterium]|nr:thiamine pyrophosphate-binding protein [Thermoanaerobaculia bacterium]